MNSTQFNPILSQFDYNLPEIEPKSCTTPLLKLRENQLKLIINSWKINENDPIFEWNSGENSDKIDLNPIYCLFSN